MIAKASLQGLLCVVLLQACSSAPIQTTPPEPTVAVSSTPVARVEATAVPTTPSLPTLEPTLPPTATLPPTPEPTATVWPPQFVFWTLRDIRQELDSFIITVSEKNTINGKLNEVTNTIGYIKQPLSGYNHNQYPGGLGRTYVVDGWTYELTGSGDWYISAGASEGIFSSASIPGGNAEKLGEAQFAGQENYEGIPAYHFVLAPVNLTNTNTNSQLEGDFYLARDGNYILYAHWKETSQQGDFKQVYEVTQSLSSINQLAEIKLPADMTEMVAAAQLPVELGLPVPGDSTIKQMIRYKHGIGVDLYFFTKPQMNADEFLDFYRNLPETAGWKVTHIGHVTLHEDDCEFTWDCVIINKGTTQVILFYSAGSIRAEFDWPRLYSPKVGN